MTSTDPISDMLTRIRNAVAVDKREISLPHSKAKETVARILAKNGFLQNVSVSDSEGSVSKKLDITIYDEDSGNVINEISRLSKPGRRVYVKSGDIPAVKRGRGIVVVSTSQGVMTGDEAKKKHLGGELICKVY